MLIQLIVTAICGLGAAGIALSIRFITRNAAPKWIIPVFAGAGMLGYLVYGEYTWFAAKQSTLPDGVVIVSTESEPILWRPWTFLVPYVTTFATVDTNNIARNEENGEVVYYIQYQFDQRLTDSVSHAPFTVHCGNRALAPVGKDGKPQLDKMKQLGANDKLYKTVCQ